MRVDLRLSIVALLLGVGAGIAYGWLVQPVRFVETTPVSLREDFRADYVLMVADAFDVDGNLQLAQTRLAALGPQPPDQIVADARGKAQLLNYHPTDLEKLDALAQRLHSFLSTPEISSP